MRRLGLLLLPLVASGCFLDRTSVAPDGRAPQQEDGGPLPDSGPGMDAGRSEDAGQREDTGTPMLDSGPSCSTADERCEGGLAYRCEGDRLTAEPCSADCWLDPSSGPRCVTCVPGAGRCVAENGEVSAEVCLEDGSGWGAPMACSRGCDAGACQPETMCTDVVAATLAPGDPTVRLNLCASGSTRRYDSSTNPGDCDGHDGGDMTPTVTDMLVRLEIAQAGNYRIQVDDDDNNAAIAPLVYIRTACADPTSQLGCWDAIDAPDFRYLDFQVSLTPGDYFVIIDGYEYDRPGTNDPRCGHVKVSVTAAGR